LATNAPGGATTSFAAAKAPSTVHPDGGSDRQSGAAAETPQNLPQIGRFLIRGRLGVGGFAAVYRAYDPQLDREVALKVPHAGTLEDGRIAQRFLCEARAAARLDHPHIVSVYDSCSEGGVHYIAAKFVEGRTLSDAFDSGTIDPRKAAEIVRQVAEALAYAHEAGIVHRDVKPSNILVDTRDKAYLADFGLAFRQDAQGQRTEDGAVLGTPAFMPPEQAAGRQGAPQPAGDQYSLGAVLYYLLCGKPPFEGPPMSLIFHALHTEPSRPRACRSDVPEQLERICLKAMAKSAEARYPSCRAMAEDLSRFLELPALPSPTDATPVPAAAPVVTVPTPAAEPSPQEVPQVHLPWTALVLAAAVGACLLIALMTAVAGPGMVFIVIVVMALVGIQYWGVELTRQRYDRRRRRR
jgi:serine/threonine protein kinase